METARSRNNSVRQTSGERVAVVTSHKSKVTGYLLLVALSLIWGVAFVAIRRADFELSPPSLTLLRWLIASAGFLTVMPFIKPRVRFVKSDFPRLFLISLANVAGYHLSLNYGETMVSSGLAGLLSSLGPVFSVLLSVVILKEKVGVRLGAALALALTGAVLLSLSNPDMGVTSILGSSGVVFAMLFFAVFGVLAKPLVEKYGPLSVISWASLLGTLTILPLAFGDFAHEISDLSPTGWAAVVFLAIPSTVVGYSLFYTLLAGGAVSRVTVQLYMIPIVSVIGGVLLLQESVTAFTAAGGAALLVAVALARKGG